MLKGMCSCAFEGNAAAAGRDRAPGPGRAQEGSIGEVPVFNVAVRGVRQLDANEQAAVHELYFAPQAELAPFAFLFENLRDAAVNLVEQSDEAAGPPRETRPWRRPGSRRR